MRTIVIVWILVVGRVGLPADPFAPRTVSLKKSNATPDDIGKAVGLPVAGAGTFAVAFDNVPFWTALERTGQRIVLRDNGRRISLEPLGPIREVSSVHGAFRTVAKQVTARLNLETGTSVYDVQLEAHWEPRFSVFRVDSVPTISRATDDRGTVLSASQTRVRTQPTGATHTLPVRLNGLTRDSRRVATLEGHFTVIAAEKMLAFVFADLTAKQPVAAAPKEGVTVVLKRIEKDEKTWECEIELKYPPGGPQFESFEADAWLSENTLRLVSPDASKSFVPDDYEIRGTTLIYRFKEDAAKGLINPTAKGWSIVCETPSPLLEYRVPFTLKDIPLG
jgi:hypothetical protein